MDAFSDYIGFFVLILFFIIPMIRKLFKEAKKVSEKDLKAKREKEELIRSRGTPQISTPPPMSQKIDSSKKRAETKRMVTKDFSFHSDLEESIDLTDIDERELQSHIDPQFRKKITSEAFAPQEMLQRNKANIFAKIEKLDQRKQWILYKEILDHPKSFDYD